jgi:hypothetical protein
MPAPALIAGPYRPPRIKMGQLLYDFEYGDLRICGISDSPIQWPLGRTSNGRRAMPIVYGDLVKAVRIESVLAVMHHWGVSRTTVLKWRKLLGVPRFNPGTSAIWSRSAPKLHTPEARKRQRAAMAAMRRP